MEGWRERYTRPISIPFLRPPCHGKEEQQTVPQKFYFIYARVYFFPLCEEIIKLITKKITKKLSFLESWITAQRIHDQRSATIQLERQSIFVDF